MVYTPYFPPIAIGSPNWGTPLNAAIAHLDEANNGWTSLDQGMIAYAFDPGTNMVASTLTSGTVTMSAIMIRQPVTVTNVLVGIGTVGAGLVAGQNFGGFYDAGEPALA